MEDAFAAVWIALLDHAFGHSYNAIMGWIGGFFGLALIAIVIAVGTDVYITKCQLGSFYAAVGLCAPANR